MYPALSTIRLGFDCTLSELVDLAVAHSFAGVEPSGQAFFSASETEQRSFTDALREHDLRWRLSALPSGIGPGTTPQVFDELEREVARRAPLLHAAGAVGFSTWIAPADDAVPAAENLALHVGRLNRITAVLEPHDLRLALEYVGPAPSRAGIRHPFVHTLDGMHELREASAAPERLALLLDSYHWYTAGESVQDLLALTADDVLAVDLNDAPAGRARDEQTDELRELPGETGVIDLTGFLGALATLDYRGPVVAEPLGQGVSALPHAERVHRARVGLKRLIPEMTS